MKYIIRSIKYFFYLIVILTILIVVMVMLKLVDADIQDIFRNGYNSLWQIGLMCAAFAAIYPKLGYMEKNVFLRDSVPALENDITAFMEEKGYRLERKNGEVLCYRLRSAFKRYFSRMGEDAVTITPGDFSETTLEGPRKDVLKLAAGLEAKFGRGESVE